MTIAAGIFKQLIAKKQSGLGVASSGTGGTSFPRTSSTLELKKETYGPSNMKPSQQESGARHGARSVEGSISGDLAVGTHQLFEASFLRQAWQTAATTGALTDITAAAAAPQFVRAGGSFITDGFKVGDVVRWTGFAGGGATANNSKNFLITALTATDMTVISLHKTAGVADAVVADAAGDSVTCTLVGKKTWIPATAHTRDYYTFEEWHSDIAVSDLFTDCAITGMNVKLPGSGMGTIDFTVKGLNMSTSGGQILTTPSAATEAGNCASVDGAVLIGGTASAVVTAIDISGDGTFTMGDARVGADTRTDVLPGRVKVSGSVTVQFENVTTRNLFINETVGSLVVALSASSDADAGVKVYVMPKVTFNGAAKDDGEKGLSLTMPFTCAEMTGSTNYVNSTLSIQDSSAA